jgi:hypothetical protein
MAEIYFVVGMSSLPVTDPQYLILIPFSETAGKNCKFYSPILTFSAFLEIYFFSKIVSEEVDRLNHFVENKRYLNFNVFFQFGEPLCIWFWSKTLVKSAGWTEQNFETRIFKRTYCKYLNKY